MRRVLLAAVLVLILGPSVGGQQPAPIELTEAIGFDYNDNEFAFYQVTRFEGSWDSQAFGTLVVGAFVDAQTPPGFTTYRVIPPFTTGTHTVIVRACNALGCGGGSAPFAFAYVGSSVPPSAPTGVRVVPRG